MRTQEEMVLRAKERMKDMFAFGLEVLLEAMDYEHAKEFLDEAVTKETFDSMGTAIRTDEQLKAAALHYLEFAWGKAQDHRGLSANRSIQKMTEYAWLLGMDDVLKKMSDTEYRMYGCPILKVISDALGAPMPDDPETLNMINGKECRPGCEDGCNG